MAKERGPEKVDLDTLLAEKRGKRLVAAINDIAVVVSVEQQFLA